MRTALFLLLFLLGSCATRAMTETLPRSSAASVEAREAPLAEPAIALREEPPLPDEPTRSPLWNGLADPDASVFPMPTEPGGQWTAQPDASAGEHRHAH